MVRVTILLLPLSLASGLRGLKSSPDKYPAEYVARQLMVSISTAGGSGGRDSGASFVSQCSPACQSETCKISQSEDGVKGCLPADNTGIDVCIRPALWSDACNLGIKCGECKNPTPAPVPTDPCEIMCDKTCDTGGVQVCNPVDDQENCADTQASWTTLCKIAGFTCGPCPNAFQADPVTTAAAPPESTSTTQETSTTSALPDPSTSFAASTPTSSSTEASTSSSALPDPTTTTISTTTLTQTVTSTSSSLSGPTSTTVVPGTSIRQICFRDSITNVIRCECRRGFTGTPPNCAEQNECLEGACDFDGAYCVDESPNLSDPSNGYYKCGCLPGWKDGNKATDHSGVSSCIQNTSTSTTGTPGASSSVSAGSSTSSSSGGDDGDDDGPSSSSVSSPGSVTASSPGSSTSSSSGEDDDGDDDGPSSSSVSAPGSSTSSSSGGDDGDDDTPSSSSIGAPGSSTSSSSGEDDDGDDDGPSSSSVSAPGSSTSSSSGGGDGDDDGPSSSSASTPATSPVSGGDDGDDDGGSSSGGSSSGGSIGGSTGGDDDDN